MKCLYCGKVMEEDKKRPVWDCSCGFAFGRIKEKHLDCIIWAFDKAEGQVWIQGTTGVIRLRRPKQQLVPKG